MKKLITFIILIVVLIWVGPIFFGSSDAVNNDGIPQDIFFTEIKNKTERNCPFEENPLTILAIGQSHAANSIESRKSAADNKNIYNYFGGTCYALEDPMLGTTDRNGTIWSRLTPKLQKQIDRPLVVMSYAAGGVRSEQWLPGEMNLGLMKRATDDVDQYTENGGKVDYIVYYQGESDALINATKNEFKNRVTKIFDYLQERYEGEQKFLIFASSLCRPYNEASAEIIAAQNEIAAVRTDTVLVFNSDLLDDGYRRDGCHFNDKGAEIITQKLLQTILDIESMKNIFQDSPDNNEEDINPASVEEDPAE